MDMLLLLLSLGNQLSTKKRWNHSLSSSLDPFNPLLLFIHSILFQYSILLLKLFSQLLSIQSLIQSKQILIILISMKLILQQKLTWNTQLTQHILLQIPLILCNMILVSFEFISKSLWLITLSVYFWTSVILLSVNYIQWIDEYC